VTAARAERRGLLLAFGAFGSFWGAWAATLPAIRAQAGVSDGQLGLALGAVAVAALPTMPLAGRLMDRHARAAGCRRAAAVRAW
jgi:MFS family permease